MPDETQSLKDTTLESTTASFEYFIDLGKEYGPKILVALLILTIGYFVARLAAKAITALCERIGLQRGAERGGLAESMQQVGIKKTVPQIIGTLIFWLLMCVFLMAGFNVMGLDKVSTAMESVVDFIPDVLLATIMVVVGLLLAALLRGVIATSADRAGLSYAQQLASAVYYVVVLITLLVVLEDVGVDVKLIHNLVLITAGALAVGFALAFGIGGREVIGGILAGYYIRQRMEPGDPVSLSNMAGTVRDVGPVATIIETEEGGLVHRHSVPNVRMLNEAIR
jgi:hypothetical protein